MLIMPWLDISKVAGAGMLRFFTRCAVGAEADGDIASTPAAPMSCWQATAGGHFIYGRKGRRLRFPAMILL